MALVSKQDSNATGLAYAEELSIKVLPGSPVWISLEPNSYNDFGGQIATVARNPINDSRQQSKGTTVDLDSAGGWNTDMTPHNLQDLMQGFMFASLRKKAELAVATVDTTIDDYQPAAGGTGYVAGDLLFAKRFGDATNNGLKVVTGTPTATSVPVTTNLVTAASQSGIISKVGHQFGAGEVDIDASGSLPVMDRVLGTFDFTTLGLIPGEWIYIGGDGAGEAFTTAANNGFKRVKSVATTQIVFDKSASTMVTEAAGSLTVRVFIGRALKNEAASLIVRRTYQLERTLGAPDDASPAQIQSEYVVGAVPNELTLTMPTADKLTADLAFVAMDHETRTGVQGVKAGTRETAAQQGNLSAFNTSSNVPRIKLNVVNTADENPTALFAFITDLSLTVNNNIEPNKAISVLGAFDASAGTFQVSGSMEVYFADVAAVAAIRANSDVTLDAHITVNNDVVTGGMAGVSLDIPLLGLGDGRANVEQDQPIKLPLSYNAARGNSVDANMDHTMLWVFYDYLPLAASTA